MHEANDRSAAHATLRAEIRAFVDQNLATVTRDRLRRGCFPTRDEIVDWQRCLDRQGWGAPNWPRENGGTGWDDLEQLIFLEECAGAPAPAPHVFNITMLGPVLIRFGRPDQRDYWLPKLRAAEVLFCQGFSEPDAGSDLASLRTSAAADGSDYVINGQKTWTTSAHYADWIFCLLRTDPSVKKQEGISFVLVDLRSPGVAIRPIISIDGRHSLNEVFFDNVRVPRSNLVGEENKGWDYARFLLGNERASIAGVARTRERLAYALELAASRGIGARPSRAFLRRIALIEAELDALERTQYRVLGAPAGIPQARIAATAALKVKGTELFQEVTTLLLDIAGPAALRLHQPRLGDPDPGDDSPVLQPLAAAHLYSRAASIYGGANEVQKTILANHLFAAEG